MKIIFYLSAFPVLSETFVLNQIVGLINRDHEVSIVSSRINSDIVTHPEINKYSLVDKTTFFGDSYEIMPRNKILRIAKAIIVISEILFSPRFKYKRLWVFKALNIFNYGKDAITLNLLFRGWHHLKNNRDSDIAFCHFAQNGEKIARMKSLGLLPEPIVTIFHGHDMSRDLVNGNGNSLAFLKRYGSLFLPVSQHWKSELMSLGFEPHKIQVHHMGVNLKSFKCNRREISSTEVNPLRLLTVGRFVEKKGIRFLLEAISTLKYRGIYLNCRIIGDGPLLDHLLQIRSQLSLTDQVEFLQPMSSDNIAQEMIRADVFVLPSVTASDGDKEGIPVVLMEAMSSCMAVVSTLHSGIPELIKHQKTGILCREKSVEDLVNSLECLNNNRQLILNLGIGARRFVEVEFNIDLLNESLEALLLEVSNKETAFGQSQ